METQVNDFRPLRFSTDDLPERDRIPAWRDFFGPRVHGVDIEPTHDAPFHTNVTVRLLPGLTLMSSDSSPTRYLRTRPLLADGRDHFCLMLNSSSGTISQRGREVSFGPGDAVLATVAETGTAVAPFTARHRQLCVRRTDLMPLLDGLEDAVPRRIAADTEVLQYLLGYFRFLEEQQTGADPELARAAAIHLRDLLALVLGPTRDAAYVANGRGLAAARLHAIKRHIADNLGDGGLTVGAVAARHRVTPRYVQRLFESEGTTFSEFALDQRLTRAHRMLADPRYASWTVSAIALEAGFGDVSYFNRCFRRRFGAPPTEFRGA